MGTVDTLSTVIATNAGIEVAHNMPISDEQTKILLQGAITLIGVFKILFQIIKQRKNARRQQQQ